MNKFEIIVVVISFALFSLFSFSIGWYSGGSHEISKMTSQILYVNSERMRMGNQEQELKDAIKEITDKCPWIGGESEESFPDLPMYGTYDNDLYFKSWQREGGD